MQKMLQFEESSVQQAEAGGGLHWTECVIVVAANTFSGVSHRSEGGEGEGVAEPSEGGIAFSPSRVSRW